MNVYNLGYPCQQESGLFGRLLSDDEKTVLTYRRK